MVVDPTAWPRPSVVQWLVDQGVEEDELRRVFNIGIGMIAVVAAADEAAALAALHEQGTDAWAIGEIESGAGVRFTA
jgi:phosphoribosylformylglycinamidine cyclo-ligase